MDVTLLEVMQKHFEMVLKSQTITPQDHTVYPSRFALVSSNKHFDKDGSLQVGC